MRCVTMSPAIIIPATGGTKAMAPGAWRPAAAWATTGRGSSLEYSTRRLWMPVARQALRMRLAKGQVSVQ